MKCFVSDELIKKIIEDENLSYNVCYQNGIGEEGHKRNLIFVVRKSHLTFIWGF